MIEPILRIDVISDPDGRHELKPGGFIGLERIRFNRSEWRADPLSALVIFEGSDLVIRREGNTIKIFRSAS